MQNKRALKIMNSFFPLLSLLCHRDSKQAKKRSINLCTKPWENNFTRAFLAHLVLVLLQLLRLNIIFFASCCSIMWMCGWVHPKNRLQHSIPNSFYCIGKGDAYLDQGFLNKNFVFVAFWYHLHTSLCTLCLCHTLHT